MGSQQLPKENKIYLFKLTVSVVSGA